MYGVVRNSVMLHFSGRDSIVRKSFKFALIHFDEKSMRVARLGEYCAKYICPNFSAAAWYSGKSICSAREYD